MVRPRKLSRTVIKKYCDARSIGAAKQLAASYAGVSYSGIRFWEKKAMELEEQLEAGGRERDSLTDYERLLLQFLKSARRATADAGITWQQVVNEAANDDPRWAAYMLERNWPKYYLPQNRLDVTSGGEKIDVVLHWPGMMDDGNAD